ncbi:hypothetical protein D3C81_2108120 [compost metagenome]
MYNSSPIHNDYSIRPFGYKLHIMRSNNYSFYMLIQPQQQLRNILASGDIQIRCRLIQQNNRWIHGDSNRKRSPSLLTSAKQTTIPVLELR